jgi:hypothetical protein
LRITYVNYQLTATQLWQTMADGGCTWFSHAADMCLPPSKNIAWATDAC